ncbi:MAG: GPW/gp25 family protein [Ginsengibacter sp.]
MVHLLSSTIMNIIYYKIPLQLSVVLEGNELPTGELFYSIKKNLELIIMTRFGEHRSDPTFGCEIWDLDFELIISETLWEEKLRKSLLKSITTHERRLSNIELAVSITNIEKHNLLKQFTEIKKRVDIRLNGIIHKTGEDFIFNTNLFLSPLSVD